MTVEKKNQSTPWYKHTLFLILINAIAWVALLWGVEELSSVWIVNYNVWDYSDREVLFTINRQIIILTASLLGLLMGSALAYTIWAKDNNFSQSRALVLAGTWASTFGAIFFDPTFSQIGIALLPALALIGTFLIISKHLRNAFTVSGLSTLFTMIFLYLLFYDPAIGSNLIWMMGGIFGVFFTYFIQRANDAEQRRQQAKQRRDTLAQGLLLADNYIVGDDGELIEAEGGENHIKGNL